MGHARAYLSFDIVRRVLSTYFNYDVLYVMNITDIDDKIIKRARQNYLFENYLEAYRRDFRKIAEDVIAALEEFKVKVDNEAEPDKKKMLTDMAEKAHAAAMSVEAELGKPGPSAAEVQAEILLQAAKDILSEWLDNHNGSSVTELSVFSKLARKFESDFLQDMSTLNVQTPDVLTRVSEYIPEIIEYIEGIIRNKYAYVTKDGSVYFDTLAFNSSPKHSYAKLVPSVFVDTDNQAMQKHMRESEGELSVSAEKMQEKKNPFDFALWKASKAGEPFWDSPWGQGRPGWHIECSAMSSAVCGSRLDIHAGGLDLKFPHHDNEIAQCEAHFDSDQWVNYFLHCGTLQIAGLKMSKSLKNFITIKQALKDYTPRQMRLLFLMHTWNDVLDYSAENMSRALSFEKFCNEFFLTVKDKVRRHMASCSDDADYYQKYESQDSEILQKFSKIKGEIHRALCDSIDTRTVMEKIREIVTMGNVYIMDKEKQSQPPNCNLLKTLAEYITWLLKMFGAIPESQQLGFPTDQNGNIAENREELVMPYLQALSEFREKIREIAREKKVIDILDECDRLRDDVLPELGVRLEDRLNETLVKLVDRETLLREREQKKAVEAAKLAEKLKKQKEKEEKDAQKRIPPQEMFKRGEHEGKYSQYDDKGVPTHAVDGKEITASQKKKLEKAWTVQKKAYDQIMAAQNGQNGHA
ncbi:cysteine--tRNA ligasecytoplasmic [Aphelenchoides avenae]|nr:cysteine--tRNA ligasecytoplasmic [Aphelenchus avenae]